MRSTPSDLRRLVIGKLKNGLSIRKVSSDLQLSVGNVSNIKKKYLPNLVNKPKTGRPRKLTETCSNRVRRLITSGATKDAVATSKRLRDEGVADVSPQTIRVSLRKRGLKGKKKLRNPHLTKRHKALRLAFAKKYEHWTNADWSRVLFTDESKICRFESNGSRWAWVSLGEALSERNTHSTVKYGGGSIMVWGCMMAHGVGSIALVHGNMNAEQYVQILQQNLSPSLHKLEVMKDRIIFQQDNDPKHTSKKAREFLRLQELCALDWPPQSPDLNPIEHLWGELKKSTADHPDPPVGMLELWERAQKAWAGLPPSACLPLVRSMPRRLRAVIRAKGGLTKY